MDPVLGLKSLSTAKRLKDYEKKMFHHAIVNDKRSVVNKVGITRCDPYWTST